MDNNKYKVVLTWEEVSLGEKKRKSCMDEKT